MTDYTRSAHQDIRLGTLANGSAGADYVKSILSHGFESFSITFWETIGDYSLPALAAEYQKALESSAAVISSIAVFGNPLEQDEKADITRASWRSAIEHAHDFGCDIVAGFTGRLRGKDIPGSIDRFREVWGEMADLAAKHQVRIAFENCSMGGSWSDGDWNIAHNPDAWELMFEALPAAHLGLEWEPCHQLVQLIDALPQLDDWGPRIFHVHGKDATVDQTRLRRHGYHGAKPWCWHRHPGFGDTDWRYVIDKLREQKFQGSIDIEGWHDPIYRDDLEMTGQVRALNYLKDCRGGTFI